MCCKKKKKVGKTMFPGFSVYWHIISGNSHEKKSVWIDGIKANCLLYQAYRRIGSCNWSTIFMIVITRKDPFCRYFPVTLVHTTAWVQASECGLKIHYKCCLYFKYLPGCQCVWSFDILKLWSVTHQETWTDRCEGLNISIF